MVVGESPTCGVGWRCIWLLVIVIHSRQYESRLNIPLKPWFGSIEGGVLNITGLDFNPSWLQCPDGFLTVKFKLVPIPCRWDANDAGMNPAKLWDYGHSMDTLWWTNIAMENHHFSWENPLFLWSFSIAFCMFTRGYEMGHSQSRLNHGCRLGKETPQRQRGGALLCRYWSKILGSRRFPEMGLPPIAGWFLMDDLGLPPWLRKPP